MAEYIRLPNGAYFELKPGENAMTGFYAASQMYPDAFGAQTKAPEEVAPKTGIGSALVGGTQRYLSQFRTGLGGGDEAAKAGIARMEEIEKARPSQVSLEKVKEAYEKNGVLSAAGEALGQVPYAIAEQVPQLASMGAGARAGAMAGRFLGPVGAGVGAGLGALTGQFLSSYVPTAGGYLEAQARAQIAEGKPVDVNPLAAYGTAIPGAALDVFTDRLLLGKGLVGRLMGFTDEQVAKKSAQELEKLAAEKLLPKLSRGEVSAGTLLKGTTKGTVEIPTEIAQQILERAQAGLPLTSDEALAEYGSAAYQAGLLSPLGGLGRISERGGAREEIAGRKQKAAADALAVQEAAATQPANLLKLFDDYTAAKVEAKRLTDLIPAAPSKKKKPEEYAKWEEETAGAREAASDHMESVLQPLRDEYRQREDLIKPLVAQRQAAQPAAAPAAPATPAAPPAPPTATELMDQYDALYQQRDQLGAQMQMAGLSGDTATIIDLHDQWKELTDQFDKLGKAVEAAGGTTETAIALDKKLDTAQKELAKAAEVGDFDAMRKVSERINKLQEKRDLVEGRAPRTTVAEQLAGTTPAGPVEAPAPTAPTPPVGEAPAVEELAPFEAPPPSITPYDFPTPYEMFGAKSVADLTAPLNIPTPYEMFGDTELARAEKFVRDTGKATVSHIAEGLGVHPRTAAELIRDLEKAGVVTPLNKRNKREIINAPTAEAPAAETPKVETKPAEAPPAGPVQHAIEGVPVVKVPVSELKLSQDVPQFKAEANKEGIVKPLKGKFADYGVAPIQLWRRLDGSLEIISGRHRWDLAKRSGRQTIDAQVFDEAAGFDQKKAATMDAEINIRDGQGTVSDYVNYFQGAQLSKEEAEARGLTRGKGEDAIAIATNGSPELIDAHRAKQVSDDLAASVANEAPKDARIQAVAIKAAQSKSAAEALNLMRAVQVIAPKPAEGGMADMFGFDPSAMLEAQEMAKIATQKQREVGQRLSAITGASKNPKLAAAEGIDIKDPAAVKRRIDELQQLKASWNNWTTSPALVGEIREAMKPAEAVEQPQANTEVTPERLGVNAEELENAIKQIDALQAETIVGEDNTPKVQALIKELEAAKIITKVRADEEIALIGTEEAPLTTLKDRLVRLVGLMKSTAAAERKAKRNKNATPAEGTLAQDEQDAMFRSKGEEPAVGMPAKEVEALIEPFRKLPVAPKISVVQSISELPEKIQAQMERDGTESAPGMYHPPTKTIYLVGDNLIDGADVGKTIAHELVGHFGLRGVLGNSYPAVMRSIYQNNKQIKAEANARMQDNPDMSLEVATEESIAERAEKDVSLNWMNRLVNLIRTKLRQWGIWKNAPIGDSEIIRLIRDSHKYVSGVTTKPSETVKALAKVAPTEADIKGHNRVESLYSGRGQKNFKEPVKTIKAYKLFRVKKNEPGKIYPLFIGKNEATAIGEWVPAEHLPTKGFAERPGWHAGILPMAPHLRTKENQMADDRVWAEVEIPADINWQDVADTQKTRDIRDRVPVGGHYRFKTSKMQGGAWIIGGALKVKRVLSNEEVADILNKAGEKDAATREQMRNPALAEAFAPSGKETAKEGDVLYRSRKPTKSVVAQRTSTADDLMALYTGLTGASSRDATMAGLKDKTNTKALKLRQRVFDQYASLVAAVTKGVDAGKLDAFRAQNLMYFLRFGQQRSDIVGQTITSGPPRVRSEKTSAGTEYFYENDAGGPTLVGMAQALEKAKGYKEEDRENAFTVYLAGKRAEQVGWNKLRFDNPVEAENEYKEVLAHLKQNKADEAAFKEAEKIYQAYNAGLLDFLVQTGAMSRQKANELKQITYVPFYRVDKDGNIRMETGDERRSIRIGNIKSEPRLKELLGDSEQILPVFTSAVQNTSMLINMAMRNQTVKDTAFVLKDLGIASRIVASKGAYADNVVHFRVHGVEHHAIIDTDMYGIPAQMIVEGLEGIKVAMPAIVRMLGVPGDIFRKFTVRNPLYMFRQLVRDPVSAWVQSGTSTVPILDSFSTLAKMATGKDTVAQRLQRAGATSSNVLVGDSRDMTKFLEDLTAGKWSLDRVFSKLDTVAQQSDAATRQVIYEDSLKKGMSHQQALMRTLESMNFSRRGTSPSMYLLASLTPFMHSQVQSLDVLYRSMRGQVPGADKLQVAQRFAARATMLAMSSMAYALIMQDDEDYKRAKPEERYGNWWVPTLGLTKENWLKIPIPYEVGFLFKALPEAVINMTMGDEKVGPGMEAVGRLLSQSQPLSMPQALKPITEVMLGSSFYSGPIESPHEKEIKPEFRYRTNSTEVAKMLGGVGGLSPIEIDYLIRGYTGTVGMAITQMANVFLRAPEAANVQQPTTKLSEVPLIGALFQTSEGRGALDATYKLIEEIQQTKGAYNKLIEDQRLEDAKQFANENASILAASSMAGYMKKTLGEMAKQARMIKASPKLTTEQKDVALENLYVNQLALSRNFLKNAERTTLR